MTGMGPRHERETIIRFDEESAEVDVWTASAGVYRRLLKRLGREYCVKDGQRHAEFKFPMNFLDLPRKKAKRVLSPTQRAAMAERLHKLSGKTT